MIPGRVTSRYRGAIRRGTFFQSRQTEIRQFGVSILPDQDVVRLNIAMHDARGVGGRQTVGHSHQHLHDLPPGAFFRAGPILQRAAINELSDQILAAIKIASVMNGENMRMIERRHRLRLALEAALSGRVGQIGE